MRKTTRRIAAVATVAAIGGLGGIALESNPGHSAAKSATTLASGTGRPIVTSSSGSQNSPAVVRNAGSPSPATHRPVVTRTSGGRAAELDDD